MERRNSCRESGKGNSHKPVLFLIECAGVKMIGLESNGAVYSHTYFEDLDGMPERGAGLSLATGVCVASD